MSSRRRKKKTRKELGKSNQESHGRRRVAAGTAPCDLPRFFCTQKVRNRHTTFLRSFPACALLVRVLAAAWLGLVSGSGASFGSFGSGGKWKVGCQVWMCRRKVSRDERKDAAGNGIWCVRDRTSGWGKGPTANARPLWRGRTGAGGDGEVAGETARAGGGD